MLDISFIRDHADQVKQATQAKNKTVDIDRLIELDDKRRKLTQEIDALRQERNMLSQGAAAKPDPAQIERAKALKAELASLETDSQAVNAEYERLLEAVPNVFAASVPIGPDESGNQVLRQVGERPEFDFVPKDHVELGEALDLIDIKRAAKVSGARFNYLKGDLALLQFAILQFALQTVTDEDVIAKIITAHNLNLSSRPFIPVVPPVLVRPETMQRMARLEPKDDRFLTANEEFVLVGSAEHSLGALHMDEIIEVERLPLRYIAYSGSFRREAGSYGKDTRGILRQHQFDKLEMETFSTAETGEAEHRLMVAIQEYLMQQLKLPYQVVAICSGDMGAPDYLQTDIETWLPGQGAYRETHTADYMTDYQSRRLMTRHKSDAGMAYVHMNDATAFAMGRTLIAIMENYQTDQGTIRVPDVLQSIMGKEEIT